MPFGIHKHSNRSKQALSDPAAAVHTQGIATPTPSSGGSRSGSASPIFAPSGTDEARTTQPQASHQQQQQQQQQRAEVYTYTPQSPIVDSDRRTYQNSRDPPARSQSTRFPNAYQQQQTVHSQATTSADDLALDSRGAQQQQPRIAPAEPPPVEHKKSKSLFDRMRSSSSRTAEQKSAPNQGSYNNTGGLARRLSKRLDNPPVIRTVQQRSSLEQQQIDWQAAQDSRTQLPSPQEGNEEDGELDPYLIRPDQDDPHSTPHSAVQEYQQQTIRPVQDDSGGPVYSITEDLRQQYHAPQQHSHNQIYHQQSGSSSSIHYHYQNQNHSQQQLNVQSGSLVTIDPYRQQNPETVSQLSYDSPVEQREEQRPASVQSNGQSPAGYLTQRREYSDRSTSIQGSRPLSQHTAMAPPPGASQPNRRPADSKHTMQGSQAPPDSRDGPPQNYSRQPFAGTQPPASGVSQTAPGPGYRGGPPQRDQYGPTGGNEQGRSTPPPVPADRDVNEAYKDLLTKYKKVKGLYFDKTAQVEQLQNTLANQRLSQSRTSLDDSEYISRFQRLDGAITNLAFNIRKDWRSISPWISQYVNQDAVKIGKQEMTAVGRACITKFLMDEIFTRTFHPGLEVDLSNRLKFIEQNIRRFSPALNNQEESDALTSKVVNWRLATLEGLRDVLSSAESEECKKQFSKVCTTNLTASLVNFLQEPVPPGIEDSAHMIVELAVSIASNLPLESRDINIVYPMPGDLLQPYIMKVEAGIPPLENPGGETSSEVDASSTASGEKEEGSKESEKDAKMRKKEPKQGMLAAMMGGNSSASGSKKGSSQPAETSSDGKNKVSIEDGSQKVRFAGFVGIEVRGRQMLGKAPVWTVS